MLHLPAQEETFCLWAAALADEGLQYQTIQGYLAAVRNLHITSGFPDPFVPNFYGWISSCAVFSESAPRPQRRTLGSP